MVEGIYPKYCPHGNPIYYGGCPGCNQYRRFIEAQRYEKWAYQKHTNLKDLFEFLFPDPQRHTKVKIRPKDTFYHLKKSDSAEDLKKQYYKLAKTLHPDKPTGSTKLFQKLSQIYHVLLERYA
jgi:hypothetical protein